jgi:hypothetical protein
MLFDCTVWFFTHIYIICLARVTDADQLSNISDVLTEAVCVACFVFARCVQWILGCLSISLTNVPCYCSWLFEVNCTLEQTMTTFYQTLTYWQYWILYCITALTITACPGQWCSLCTSLMWLGVVWTCHWWG